MNARSWQIRPDGALSDAILFLALATVGTKWMTILAVGGQTLELSNIGTVLVTGLALVAVALRGRVQLPFVLNVVLLLLVWLLFALSVRGDEVQLVIMSLAATFGAYAVANLPRVAVAPVVLWAFLFFMAFIVLSVLLSGVDFVGGLIEFTTTRDRGRFFFRVLRPIYNAYGGGGAEIERTTTLNNTVAGTFALFFILSGALALAGHRAMWIVAVISFGAGIILFSSSALLVFAFAGGVFVLTWLRQARRVWPLYLVLAFVLLVIVPLVPQVVELAAYTLTEEAANRSSRLEQYTVALDVVDRHLLFGDGFTTVGGQSIHNLFLFAFTSGGILGGIAAGIALLSAMWMSLVGAGAVWRKTGSQADALMCTCLPVLFLVRCLVGGGGGLPADIGAVALGLALVSHRRLKNEFSKSDDAAETTRNFRSRSSGAMLPSVSREAFSE